MIAKRENLAFETNSPDESVSRGKELAAVLKQGDVVSLTGVLGAGKTCLISGIAIGLGIGDNEVKSPSFTLINEYYGKTPLFHFDLYRMKDVSELHNIGWDDYLMREGIVVVEWGERAEEYLPEKRIDIEIKIVAESVRGIKIFFKD